MSRIIIILITLSEDNDEKVSKKCKLGLESLSSKLNSNYFRHLLQYLEEDFYRLINSIPRTFNGIGNLGPINYLIFYSSNVTVLFVDNHKQQSSLNLLIGYIRLFGKYELVSVLHSTTGKLIESLLYICELEKSDIQLLEEWTIQGFRLQ